MNKQQLTAKIEELRQQLFVVATKESLTSPNVQYMSKSLDRLLNKYEHLTR